MISEEFMATADTNEDGQINYGDNIDNEHLDILIEYCDANNDGTINECEVFDCVVACENEWRAEYCPNYGDLYCENAYAPCEVCEGAWTCEDVYGITNEVMAYYDTNEDGAINPEDDVEPEHY